MTSPAEYRPTAALETLQQRSLLLQAIRNFFRSRAYWEVETPILSHDCCIDQWLDPFSISINNDESVWLQTSPEFALKRLICAGADRIFEVTRSFRQEESGIRHNPEFTMIEWYQRECDHHDQMDFVEALINQLQEFILKQTWTANNFYRIEKFQRFTYEQAFQEFVGLSPAQASLGELASVAAQGASVLPQGIQQDRDGLLNLLLTEKVEPALSALRGVFLYDYPASQAALAKIRPGSPPVAERFELYLDGIEICNGYHELTDADELRGRMQLQNKKRQNAGKCPLPVKSQLLLAMEQGMPECSGVALGFDRLAMWCLGLESLQDVIAFPFDRA